MASPTRQEWQYEIDSERHPKLTMHKNVEMICHYFSDLKADNVIQMSRKYVCEVNASETMESIQNTGPGSDPNEILAAIPVFSQN
jgi:uncharacterized protein YegP (UPF0339 family)